ncbi:hypothetical protein QEN19_000056 [Hanseniaspora menglaensis]
MKTISFLPDILKESNQIINLEHPSLDGKKTKIELILSNSENCDEQNIYWFQESKFGKSPEGKELTIKSIFFNNINDIKKGGIIPNGKINFCTLYDISFSIIAFFYKENKLNFIEEKDTSTKLESLNDIHMSLFEKSNKNWRYVKTSKIKESLIKFCHYIEEDHGEDSKELYFKVTKDNFIKFVEKKLNKIADSFPKTVFSKILEKYSSLSLQEENIQREAKLFFALELLTSLIPFELYNYLNKEFRTHLYPNFINFKEIDNVKETELLKEQELLLQTARNVSSNMKDGNKNGFSKLTVKTSVSSIQPSKKRKTGEESKKVSVGALDSFFKARK